MTLEELEPEQEKKHLATRRELSDVAEITTEEVTRGKRHLHGIKVHGFFFAGVSLFALITIIVLIAIASGTMAQP